MKRLWLIGLVLVACSGDTREEMRITNVVRVYMHQPCQYTFDIQVPESKEISSRTFYNMCGNMSIPVRRIADVPANLPMWVKYTRWNRGCVGTIDQNFEIHLHSVTDINGAGWDHGKGGYGTTTIVE